MSGSEIVGKSEKIKKAFDLVKKFAPTDETVLLIGPTGSGKGRFAEELHRLSRRSGNNFVAINCAAFTETLLESELFGYEKGAFTGADHQKKGRFEIANGSTLFLDEVDDMSPAMQVKVLKAIEEHAFERVGGTETVRVNVRIIAAAKRDLSKEVEGGRFRDDLYYRLNVLPISIPPLRELENLIKRSLALREDREIIDKIHDEEIKKATLSHIGLTLVEGQDPESEIDLVSYLVERTKLPVDLANIIINMKKLFSLKSLKETGGNKVRAAKLLGIYRDTLDRWLKGENI